MVDRARLAGATKAQAEVRIPRIDLDVLDVSFGAIPDREEREYFFSLPTSFTLRDEAVDRLRDGDVVLPRPRRYIGPLIAIVGLAECENFTACSGVLSGLRRTCTTLTSLTTAGASFFSANLVNRSRQRCRLSDYTPGTSGRTCRRTPDAPVMIKYPATT